MSYIRTSDVIKSINARGLYEKSITVPECIIVPAEKLSKVERVNANQGFYGGIINNTAHEIIEARLTRGDAGIKTVMGLEVCGRELRNIKPMAMGYGNYCYGGAYTWHYGHFLLESLSRLPSEAKDRHDSIFLYHDITNGMVSPHIKFFLKALGVTAFPITVPTCITGEIEISPPKVRLHSYFMQDHAVIYQQIVDYVKSKHYAHDEKYAGIVYLSRSKLTKDKRKLSNEAKLENSLIENGVEVIHMQDLALEEQILTMSNADVVIGPLGSAMHNTVFCKRGTKIIYLCEKINDNFPLCDNMIGHDAIYCVTKSSSAGSWLIDIPSVLRLL